MISNLILYSNEKNNIRKAGKDHNSHPIFERFEIYIGKVMKPVNMQTLIKSNLEYFSST